MGKLSSSFIGTRMLKATTSITACPSRTIAPATTARPAAGGTVASVGADAEMAAQAADVLAVELRPRPVAAVAPCRQGQGRNAAADNDTLGSANHFDPGLKIKCPELLRSRRHVHPDRSDQPAGRYQQPVRQRSAAGHGRQRRCRWLQPLPGRSVQRQHLPGYLGCAWAACSGSARRSTSSRRSRLRLRSSAAAAASAAPAAACDADLPGWVGDPGDRGLPGPAAAAAAAAAGSRARLS